MSRKAIKLNFCDKWGGFVPEEDYYYKLLSRHYDIEISASPDYLICSQHGHGHYKYNCVKIADIGENMCADFNEVDYAVGFDYMTFEDRYLRMPLYAFYAEYPALARRDHHPSPEALLNRKFCSFVVSNNWGANPIREKFFHELSKYKKVDSGGRLLNNIGGPVANKAEFCRQYKFNIAFENSSSRGYTTEKVMHPLSWFSVPIYWGNPVVDRDFKPEAMVWVKDESDIERAIEEIVRLDKDDAAYLERVTAPCLVQPIDYYEKQLEEFLVTIVEQPLDQARRVCQYGMQPLLRSRRKRIYNLVDRVKGPASYLSRMMQVFH